jgi:protein O-GlcNAc transferase
MFKWLRNLGGGKAASQDISGAQQAPKQAADGDPKQWMKDGFARFQAGDVAAARALFEKTLTVQPEHGDALYFLGVIMNGQGQNREAADLIARAIRADPAVASYHFTLANVLQALGGAQQAQESLGQAVRLAPDDADFHNALGCSLHQSGNSEAALEHFRHALLLAPVAPLYVNLGIALQALGRYEEAAQNYRDALALAPSNADAENNLGAVLHARGQYEEAIACFRRVLERAPHHVQCWINLGIALQCVTRVDEAAAALQSAIRLDPHNFSAHSRLAIVLREQGRLAESVASSERALAIQDSTAERARLATLLPVIARSAEEIGQWRTHFSEQVDSLMARGGSLADPLRENGTSNFNLAYQPECDRDLQEKAARLYSALCPSLLYTAPHCRRPLAAAGGRIKVGFISKFMYVHSIGRTTRGLFANVDRDRFEVIALFVPPMKDDDISRFIRASADDYLVLPDTLLAAREKIAALELDILFYQDIGMDAYTYFLAYSRLAPVQCVSFGHPDTTGIPNMDYWVSCENFEPEGAAAHYSEQLFLLCNVGTLAYYYHPTLVQPAKTRAHFGLSDDKHIYLCAQALFKLHPDFDAMLAGILRGDEKGEIVLVEARVPAWGEMLKQRLQSAIPDVYGRIRFVPSMSPDDFLNLIAVGDVMLDTIYFNGMNTSLEAFALGTPVVTQPSGLQRGRHTYGMYQRMGYLECVAQSPEQYVAIALGLGTDSGYREEVKAEILSRCPVLFEDMEVVREFERFFVEAHGRAVKQSA